MANSLLPLEHWEEFPIRWGHFPEFASSVEECWSGGESFRFLKSFADIDFGICAALGDFAACSLLTAVWSPIPRDRCLTRDNVLSSRPDMQSERKVRKRSRWILALAVLASAGVGTGYVFVHGKAAAENCAARTAVRRGE